MRAVPGPYWRALENEPPESSYPTEFITALTEAGYLAALIPEAYGGSGLPIRGGAVILETINRMGCSASAGHAQMYTMGTVLRHGSDAQKAHFLPRIASGELRLQAFGVTEPTIRLRHHAAQDARDAPRQWLRGERPEGVDQPRRAFRSDAAARAYDAARRG